MNSSGWSVATWAMRSIRSISILRTISLPSFSSSAISA